MDYHDAHMRGGRLPTVPANSACAFDPWLD